MHFQENKINKIFLGAFLLVITLFSISAYNFDESEVEVSFYTGNLTNFTDLADTPASYAGNAGLVVRANAGEDALEFINLGTLYYPVSSNPLSYWNDTSNSFNKTYADTLYLTSYTETDPLWTANQTDYSTTAEANALYKDIGITTWNETFALFNKPTEIHFMQL